MSGLNILRLREIFDTAFDAVTGTLKTSGGIASNTVIEYGAGATTAKTQRVAIASDSALQPQTTQQPQPLPQANYGVDPASAIADNQNWQ